MEILQKVYEIISERDKNPQEGSYTNSLLAQGIDKICKKIGEEATEVVIAAKNSKKQELIGEVSDLLYHLLVLLYQQKITLADIEKELTSRFGKGGFHGRTR